MSRTFFCSLIIGFLCLGWQKAFAEPRVKGVYQDWHIQCDTPPGAPGEQCALVQDVIAEDRPNVEMRAAIVKTNNGQTTIFRMVTPLGTLLTAGLGLKIDGRNIGSAGFVRCLPSGCYVELIMDDSLIGQFSQGEQALFIIFQSPEEGIGVPFSLAGFAEGLNALE
jgi:invasion protein IalB